MTLEEGAGSWTTAGELPVAMLGLRGVSLDNNIFMTGNIIIHKLSSSGPGPRSISNL